MKNLSKLLLLTVVMLSFAFTTKTDSFENETTTSEISTEDEALYCSVTVGKNSATCWFCNCAELAASLK